MIVELISLPEQRVAGVRHVGPYHEISSAFQRLSGIAESAGLNPGLQLVAVYHDDPKTVAPAELRSDAGLVVPADHGILPAGLEDVKLPAGMYARALYVGPYSGLGAAWQELWHMPLPDGKRAKGIAFDRYLNTPADTAPAELKTELYVQVE